MKPMTDIGYLFQHVAGVLQRQTDQVLQERLGIGMSQFKILMVLQESPNIEQRRLADSLGQTEASISRQVKLLLERGMLASQIDPQERRRHITMLTPKGNKVVQAAQEVVQQYTEPAFAALSDKQRSQLLQMLTELHEQSCAPGRPMACDRPFSLENIYTTQKQAVFA
jgi:DNA-binding MarR family transcriptional regulator